VQGEVGQQLVEFAFVAHQAHRTLQLGGDLEQPVGGQLGQGIGNADRQAGARAVGLGQRFLHLLSQKEDLVRIRERKASGFGKVQATALLGEQGLAHR
jgi:hypothetical protein